MEINAQFGKRRNWAPKRLRPLQVAQIRPQLPLQCSSHSLFLSFCTVSWIGFRKDLAPWEGIVEALVPVELSWAQRTTLQQYCPPHASFFTPLCLTEDQQLLRLLSPQQGGSGSSVCE